MSGNKQERPFLANFQVELRSPKVPGRYDSQKQIRVDSSGSPVVETTKGIMGTTRTGEHAGEC